jgi:putative ABC transport system permease protein
LVVSLAFAAWPLYEAGLVRPGAVLREERADPGRAVKAYFGSFLLLSVFGLLLFLIGDAFKALQICAGLLGVGAVTGLCSTALVRFLKVLKPKNLALRTAFGSWRSPEARSELVIFILSTCLAILYTAVISEQALRQSWIDAMPPESPNLIFLDIQPDQLEAFKKEVGAPVEVFARMRVRVQEINGKPLDRSEKRGYWKRDGRGKLDALPTLELPENDKLLEGRELYQGEAPEQVSLRDDIAEALEVGLGDRLTFNIQGVPVSATVSSLRSSTRKGFQPSFELLFPPALVEGAPQNVFASARLPDQEVGPLQTRLAKLFPGIVSMDLSLTIKLISERLIQMVGMVQYFLWSGIAAGILILVSATWSARQRRARESAYYKVMGADTAFLNRVIWLENLILGAACSGLGLGLATLVSWGLCRWKLEVPFPQMGDALFWMFAVPTLGVAVMGWLVGRKVVFSRPATYLREG